MRLVLLAHTALALAAVAAMPLHAEERRTCVPGTPIERIEIERINVFDTSIPEEDRGLFRFVNVLHKPNLTREWTVRALLTIREGDPCSPEALEEAARSLRALSFVQDAWVETVEGETGGVVVRVRVQDSWSTRVSASIDSEGGETETSFGIREVNLLGSGSRLAYKRDEDQDRTERSFTYSIPSIGRSRWSLALASIDNSDGEGRSIEIRRPFWRLDARWSFSFAHNEIEREDKVYACESLSESASLTPCIEPDDVDRYDLDQRVSGVRGGWAPWGLEGGETLRFTAGFERAEDIWLDDRPSRPIARPELTPRDRDLTMAVGSIAWRRIDFRELQYLNSARRVEDFDVGDFASLTIRRSLGELSEDSGGELIALWGFGSEVNVRAYAHFSGLYTQRLLEGDWYRKIVALEGRFVFKPTELQSILIDLDLMWGDELEGPDRFLLGGSFGMRAYASRSFVGDRAFTLNLEHRFFAPWYLGRIARVGLVGFAEAGGAWESGESLALDKVHPGVGIGLRAQLLRSSSSTCLHFNAAYPLDPNGGPENESIRFSFVTASGW